MSDNKFQIVWLKRDLRLQDHEPLEKALSQVSLFGRALLLYCHEPSLLMQPDTPRYCHRIYLCQSLQHTHRYVQPQLHQRQHHRDQGSVGMRSSRARQSGSERLCQRYDNGVFTACQLLQLSFMHFRYL